jgi:lipoprotein NlpD
MTNIKLHSIRSLHGGRPITAALAGLALVALAGCASSGKKAPVEDRQASASRATASGPTGTTSSPAPLITESANGALKAAPGQENAGKAGYYAVKAGDTLIRIGLDNGQNWRDVARWNGLDNPNLIEVGQVLRVVPPGADPAAASSRAVATAGRVETRPLDGKPAAAAATANGTGASAAVPAAAAPAREGDENLDWLWPANGVVATPFDDNKSKGLAIAGKAGDPVLAAADGRVVYAGAGLRGYGNLVIVKHNSTYLTAYAHNQMLLVKEEQVVRRGQKIAEMGSSDADRVQLHFEIRRQGKPIDPAKLLPPR